MKRVRIRRTLYPYVDVKEISGFKKVSIANLKYVINRMMHREDIGLVHTYLDSGRTQVIRHILINDTDIFV